MTDSIQAPAPAKVQRIVVGIDGSEGSQRALLWAVDEARLRDAEIEVVHSWHIPYTGGYYAAAAIDWRPVEKSAQAVLDHAVDGVETAGLRHPVTRTLSTDGPAPAILAAAKDADLVIVGSRGRGGFTGLLLGSVSHQVAHHATCPVVVVPGSD
jgi:nucleotide-binding universal stress UspA family protein